MKRFLSSRWLRRSAGLVLAVLGALACGAWYFRIGSWRDLEVYWMMSEECHPVWKDLYWGRIQPGQDVEEVIAATNPVGVDRYGRFVRLSYQSPLSFTGVGIMAKDGRVASASAGSCTWTRVFFNELTPEDDQAYSDAYEAHWKPIRKRRAEAARKEQEEAARKEQGNGQPRAAPDHGR